MKILEVCTSQSWGGMEMRTLKVAEAFKELGHSVTLLCHPESSLHNEATKADIDTITLPFKNGIHLYLILKLCKHLKQNRFDLIHTQFSRDLRFLVPALKGMNNTPLVLTKRLASFINKKDLFHKYLYNRVDLITAISRVIQENVIETCPVEPSKVEIIYNGINVEKFQSALNLRFEKRRELGVTDEIVIAIFGRFSPGKGHEEFLEAAKIIISRNKNVKFLVVGSESYGEPEYAQSIYNLADSCNLKEKLIFTGFREDVPELMGAIDILAVPSHAEAFGNVAIEGMAAGKPVVAANNYGLLDIVVDQKTGLLFKVKETDDLADKLITLIDDHGRREKLGNAGLQRVNEVFDEQKQIKKLEQRFFDLIEAKKND